MELPLYRRDITNILNLGTGVTQRPGFGDNSVLVVNGLPPAAFGFTIDGTDANQDIYDGSMGLYQNFQIVKGVSLDAVQEVQIAKDIFSSEIAGTMSGNVNLITKSGTNGFHGSAFENYQAGGIEWPPAVFTGAAASRLPPVRRIARRPHPREIGYFSSGRLKATG